MPTLSIPKTVTTSVTAASYSLLVTADESSNVLAIGVKFFSAPDDKGRAQRVSIDPKERRGPNADEKSAFFATKPTVGELRSDFDKRACALFLKNQYDITA